MRPASRRLALLAPAALALLAACSTGTPEAAPPLGSSSAAAPAAGGTSTAIGLGADAFADRVATAGTVVLDVRTPAEFAQGHLPGAINLDAQSEDFRDRLGELDQGDRYAVYCRSGNRSAQALGTMGDLGFVDLAHLEGGIGAWLAADLPVLTG